MATRLDWDDDSFRRFSNDVLVYEVRELRKNLDRLPELGGSEAPAWNATVEALAIHLRNLIEFLFHDGEKGRVTAKDFGVTMTGKAEFDALYGMVSAQVAHITRSRLELPTEEKTYTQEDIERVLGKMGDFVRSAPVDRIGDGLRAELASRAQVRAPATTLPVMVVNNWSTTL